MKPIKYQHDFSGSNSRLDELQAAILEIKIGSLDADNEARRDLTKHYTSKINHPDITLPQSIPKHSHVYHQYVIRHPDRNGLQQHLSAHGIENLNTLPKSNKSH